MRIRLLQREPQRAVERADRTDLLGHRVDGLAVDPELHGRLGPEFAAVAFDDHAITLHFEKRTILPEVLAHEKTERRVGGLVLVATELPLLEFVDQPFHFRPLLVELESEFARLQREAGASGHVGDEHARAVADEGRVDVLVAARHLLRRIGVQAALVRERRVPDERRLRVRPQVRKLIEKQRKIAQLAEMGRAVGGASHLEQEVGEDGRQIGVADPLAVTVGGALHQGGAGGDARQRQSHAETAVVVAVHPDLVGAKLVYRPRHDVLELVDHRAAVGIAE